MQANPDLRGIFAINDPAALGARAALEKANREDQVVIVGFDGQPEGKQAIKEGRIYADPIRFLISWARKWLRLLSRIRGRELPAETLIPIIFIVRRMRLKILTEVASHSWVSFLLQFRELRD